MKIEKSTQGVFDVLINDTARNTFVHDLEID